jgi:predicted protein tyrosine phosphatase
MGKFRSRTAELLCLFGGEYAKSAGTDLDAESPVSDTLLRTANIVVCMENNHKVALREYNHYMAAPTVTLGIPDVFNRMEDQLCLDLIYQMQVHYPDIALKMQKGYELLKSNPQLLTAFSTFLPATGSMSAAGNPAFSIFPQI